MKRRQVRRAHRGCVHDYDVRSKVSEIAAYGTDIALARALGEKELVDLLTLTLEEEKQTDLKLTEVTEQHIMPAALGEDEAGEEPGARKKPASRAKAA
jgi:hypothetical protein